MYLIYITSKLHPTKQTPTRDTYYNYTHLSLSCPKEKRPLTNSGLQRADDGDTHHTITCSEKESNPRPLT